MLNTVEPKRSFASDEGGAVAIMFGLFFIVLAFAAGMAIDYGRVVHTQSKFAHAADAAALAAGRALLAGSSEDDAEAIALRFFEQNVSAGGSLPAGYTAPEIDVDASTGGVRVSASPVVEMTLTAVLGYENMAVPVVAATKFDQKDVELAIQLDLTGSMCMPCDKIDALKDATRNLLGILLPEGGVTNKVRIGFAPYSAGVNLGSYAAEVTNNQHTAKNCVYDRSGPDAEKDTLYGPGSYFKGKKDLGSANDCPEQELIPLTSNRAILEDAVDAFTTGGTTAGQLGTNWAWNIISPAWKTVWPEDSKPVEYNDGKTLKAVILMTDGEYNTFDGRCDAGGCDPYGTRGTNSNDNAKAMCSNMKNEGVVVYTVGFFPGTPHPEALSTLGACASSENHAFIAENASDLNQAFALIAQQLNNLRLTN